MGWKLDDAAAPAPRVLTDWDEASCTQLVYLYTEVARNFGGDALRCGAEIFQVLKKIIDGKRIKPSDVILGLASNGAHSNGYSLVRKIISTRKVNLNAKLGGKSLKDLILAPTRIYVKPVLDVNEALRGADAVRDHTSTVGLAAQEHELETLAKQFARWGATRLCPLGQMQNPPLAWRHDGRGLFGDLVRWTDWEQ